MPPPLATMRTEPSLGLAEDEPGDADQRPCECEPSRRQRGSVSTAAAAMPSSTNPSEKNRTLAPAIPKTGAEKTLE